MCVYCLNTTCLNTLSRLSPKSSHGAYAFLPEGERASTERVCCFEAMHIYMLFLSFWDLSTMSVSLVFSQGKILPR